MGELDWSAEEAARLGATLRRIDAALVKDPDKNAWIQGGEKYLDVFVELADGRPSWAQITVRGRAIEWAAEGETRSGTTSEKAISDGHPSSHTVTYDAVLDRKLLAFVRVMLSACAREAVVSDLLFLLPKAG